MTANAAPHIHAPHKHLTVGEWTGFMAMVVGMFMAILDIQIVASSLMQIQAGLSASADEIIWVQSAYLIAEVVMIPLSGWLSRAFSTRILFTVSCVGFTLMSFMCALAWDLNSMIVFRALQGFIGGAMIPTVFATIFILFPPAMRPMMSIVIGLVVTVAPTAGPVLGGYLTETFSWHMMFLINVIPGIIVSILSFMFIRFDEPDYSLLKKIDFQGIAYVALCLGSLQYVLEEGVRKDWLSDNGIAFFSLMALVFGILMIWRELSTPHPIVDLKAFMNRNFAAGCFFSFILGWGLYTAVALQPQFLAQVRGYNSLQVGICMSVIGYFQLFSAPVCGMLSKKMDPRVMLGMGIVMFGTAVWMNGMLTNESGYWELFIPQALRGASMMFCFLPINNMALGTLPTSHVKNASGLFNLTRNLGGAFGLAVTNTLQLRWNHDALAVLRTNITPGNPVVQTTLDNLTAKFTAMNIANPDAAAVAMLNNMALREAATITYNECFKLIAIIFLSSLLLVWLFEKVDLTKPPPEGAH
jgi:DHA2 family multidrug resistance protein